MNRRCAKRSPLGNPLADVAGGREFLYSRQAFMRMIGIHWLDGRVLGKINSSLSEDSV